MFPFLLAALMLAYVAVCVHVALRARSYGRRPVVWFFITFFCTAIPATIVFRRDQYDKPGGRVVHEEIVGADEDDDDEDADGAAQDTEALRGSQRDESRRGAPGRCPHCGHLVSADELDRSAGLAICPRCGLVVNKEHTA